VIGCKLKQNANVGCNSCASLAGLVLRFIACFILPVIAPLRCILWDAVAGKGGKGVHPTSATVGLGICRNSMGFRGGVGLGWGESGVGVYGVSRLRHVPLLVDQRSLFYTAWKMRLSATECVYISGSGA